MHGKAVYVSDVLDRCKKICVANGGQEDKSKSYAVQNLSILLKKKLPSLTICNDSTKENIAFKARSISQTLA